MSRRFDLRLSAGLGGRLLEGSDPLENFSLEEHRRLIASVNELFLLPEIERIPDDDPSGTDSGASFLRFQSERRADRRESLEVGPMDSITEPRPPFVPSTAVKKPSVDATEASGGH